MRLSNYSHPKSRLPVPMDLKDQLRQLKQQILDRNSGSQAFETWDEIKSDLSPRQRVSILTAWNYFLRTNNERPLVEAIQEVKENP